MSTVGGSGGIPLTSSTSTGGIGGGGKEPIVCAAIHEYSNIPPGECDLLQQDCPAGQTCRPTPAGGGAYTTKCIISQGLKGVGTPCTSATECQAGLFCNSFQCAPVCCNGSPDDLPCMGGQCNLEFTYSQDPKAYVWLCTYAEQCVPLTPMACPEGQDCHIEDPGVASCFPPSGAMALEGEACAYLNDCGDMLHCQANVCRYMCSLQPNAEPPGLGGCPVDQTCVDFPQGGIADLGVCSP